MRKLLSLICFAAICNTAMAQKDSLAVDDHGRYIYYKLINTGTNTAAVLYARSIEFLKTYNKSALKITAQDAKALSVTGEGYLTVMKAGAISKHDDGSITCKLHIEVKDAKYRYWFTDFVFTPFERDRYNNYVPKAGLDIPIEAAGKKLSQKDADHYLDECAKFSKQVGAKLQEYMLAAPVVKKDTVAKKVISINKW